jgi:hypothetical protein
LQAPAADDDDDDDVDLFGEETEEEKKAAEERAAKAKASSKKKECNVSCNSLYFCCHMYSFVRNFNCKACNVSPNVPQ